MFSKNRNIIYVIVAVIAVICIFIGHRFYNLSMQITRQLNGNVMSTDYESTTYEEVTYAPAEDDMNVTEAVDDGNSTSESLPVYESTTSTNLYDVNVLPAEFNYYATYYSELFRQRKNYNAIASIFITLGIIATALFLFISRKEEVFIAVEPDMLFALATVLMIMKLKSLYLIESTLIILFLFVAIFSLHDIIYWVSHKFSLEASFQHKIGMVAFRRTNKVGSYLLVIYIWCVALFCGLALVAGIYLYQFILLKKSGIHPQITDDISMILIPTVVLVIIFCILNILLQISFNKGLTNLEHNIELLHNGEDTLDAPNNLEANDSSSSPLSFLSVATNNNIFNNTNNQLKELKTERDTAIENAITSERFKVDLISNVSHDLRTPLTSILGYGELLQNETLSEEGSKQLAQLNLKAGYMRDLVDELFELTKVSSGALKAKEENIDLIKLLEQTIGLFEDKLAENNLIVRRHYCKDSISIISDGAMLHQVFANLLGNAIKYSIPGTRIHLSVLQNEASEASIATYSIRMTNIASYEMDFTPEEIVQRFARGDKARTTNGSGLGLAIVETYTSAISGNFRIEIDGDQFIATVELNGT